ncbi:MAG: hypothetical protein ACOYN4_17770, partial [Bacteroidales bacterium]
MWDVWHKKNRAARIGICPVFWGGLRWLAFVKTLGSDQDWFYTCGFFALAGRGVSSTSKPHSP